MSTTAGITSQDYVAINILAVISTLLGFASLLAKLNLLLLVIPLVGVLVGLVALTQINRSNGTQTGRAFALTGILLSLLMGGGLIGMTVYDRLAAKSDERVIVDKVLELGEKLKNRRYSEAYAMFNDRFKARIKPDAFETRLQAIEKNVGTIQSFEWNEVPPQFESDPDSETRLAGVIVKVGLGTTGGAGRWQVTFRNAGSGWAIDDIPSVFPPENPRSRGPGGQ